MTFCIYKDSCIHAKILCGDLPDDYLDGIGDPDYYFDDMGIDPDIDFAIRYIIPEISWDGQPVIVRETDHGWDVQHMDLSYINLVGGSL